MNRMYCVILKVCGYLTTTDVYGPYESRKEAREVQMRVVNQLTRLGYARDQVFSEVKEMLS